MKTTCKQTDVSITIIHLIKDAIKVDMKSVHDNIVKSNKLTEVKSNNKYFKVIKDEISKEDLITALVCEVKDIINKFTKQIETMSGGSVDKICSFINEASICYFFDVIDNASGYIIVEINAY